jgi:hypothetical protein
MSPWPNTGRDKAKRAVPARDLALFGNLRPDLKADVAVGPLTEKQLTAARIERR